MNRQQFPRLLDTGPICYVDNRQQFVWRPARTWRLDENTVLTIVTETDEPTMSIETAAGKIRHGLEGVFPHDQVRIIEHWPAGTGVPDNEHYAEQHREPGGLIRWTHTDYTQLYGMLGPDLEDTTPTGPVVNGTYPSRRTEADR